MSALDRRALAARFRQARAGQPAPAPAGDPGPWLTAEAYLPPNSPEPAPVAAGGDPPATEPPPPPGSPTSWPTPGPSRRRRPKRRRWTMPSSPAERTAEPLEPPPARYRCPHCGGNHQPTSLEGGGPFAAYARQIVPWDDGRPPPVSAGYADTSALRRDGFRPWRARSTGEVPTPGTTLADRLRDLWHGSEAAP